MSETWTIRRAVLWTADYLASKGADSPRTDADLLLADALGVDRLRLLIDFDKPLRPEELAAYRERIQRRAAGESLAYVLGVKEFYGRDFAVDERVLVPRPETEGLVELGLQVLDAIGQEADGKEAQQASSPAEQPTPPAGAASQSLAPAQPAAQADAEAEADDGYSIVLFEDEAHEAALFAGEVEGPVEEEEREGEPAAETAEPPPWDGSGAKVLDLCAGSGCVGITLALERPGLQVDLVELDPGAAAVSRQNVQRHGLEARCQVWEGDLFAALGAAGPYQLIVSNPPYVPSAEIDGLTAEVLREPRLALDGGKDGLDVVRRIVAGAKAHLAPGGSLALELSLGQPEVVAALLRDAGFAEARVVEDFTRRDRYVIARA